MRQVSPVPIDAVIDFVNDWSPRVRQAAGEADAPHPRLPEALGDAALAPADLTDDDLAEIADRLHSLFDADSADQRLGLLNDAIRRLDPTPAVTRDGPRWTVPDERGALEAALLLGLAEHARADPSLERLGTCRAHRCVDAYVDTSQAHTRRYCSVTCQNRVKAAAYRRRRRA